MTLATVLGNLLFDLRGDRGLERARAFVNVRDLFRDGVLRPLVPDHVGSPMTAAWANEVLRPATAARYWSQASSVAN